MARSSFKAFYDKKKILMELGPLLIILVMFAIGIYVHPLLPEKVPIHWNAAGVVDNYGSRFYSTFLLPIIYAVFAICSIILPAMDVFSENIKKFYNYYYAMKIMFGLFFLAVDIAIILPNFGYIFNMSYLILIMVAILFFAIGYILRHVKRNFFIGIRTPWTLSNEKVWDRTHDIGGILFMAFAVLLIIGAFILQPVILFFMFMILIILIVIFLMFYSYGLYRKL